MKLEMKIGYPCLNRTLKCRVNRTFRIRNYSEERLIETVSNNLQCLDEIIRFNMMNGFLFFRISSDIIPFASHPVCQFKWQKHFTESLKRTGDLIRKNDIRISMHPDQFTLLNSLNEDVYKRSIEELKYHTDLLDLMELDSTAKIQIHVGGVYGDKGSAIERFIERYNMIDSRIRKRLVIENDDRLYSLSDCLLIHSETGIPILFDVFHHSLLNGGESLQVAFKTAAGTWKDKDGLMMVDYSSQEPSSKTGKHANTIDESDFASFLDHTVDMDFDIMLEIKDKEISARKAIGIASEKIRCLQ